MLENNLYNLMHQLVEESQSLWHLQQNFQQNTAHCAECEDLWKNLKIEKESHIEILMRLIKSHLKSNAS